MIDSTNNSFEEQWRHAFDDAQLTPPASVWEKIELSLEPQNKPPSKPNFGNKPYYFLGGLIVLVVGIFVWVSQDEKMVNENKIKDINKTEVIEDQVIVEENKPIDLVKEVKKAVKKKTNQTVVSEEEIKDNNKETETEIIEEIPVRPLTDSVAMIEPLSIKNIHSQIENPTLNYLPTDQTPYYVKPTPKPQKKSIFKNVKISVGAGVYQQ